MGTLSFHTFSHYLMKLFFDKKVLFYFVLQFGFAFISLVIIDNSIQHFLLFF